MKSEAHFLYLLKHSTRPAFKIGITNNVIARVMAIEAHDKLDYKKCVFYESDRKCVRGMEHALHYLFRDYRLKPWNYSGGKTEWFSNHCRLDVEEMIRRMSDRHGLTGPFNLPTIPVRLPDEPKPIKPEYVKKKRSISDVRLRVWTIESNKMLNSLGIPSIDWDRRYVPLDEANVVARSLLSRGTTRDHRIVHDLQKVIELALKHLDDLNSGLA